MSIATVLSWLDHREFAVGIAQSEWVFPIIETVHVFAISIVVGTIWIIDVRLAALTDSRRSVSQLIAAVLPWTWTAFAVAACAGSLLFCSKATLYADNPAFRVKVVLLGLAATNMLTFHLVTARTITSWDRSVPPWPARAAGFLSLTLWLMVVAAGRWTGYFAGG